MRRQCASNYATLGMAEPVEQTCYRHPDRVTGLGTLTEPELKDLIDYLKSL